MHGSGDDAMWLRWKAHIASAYESTCYGTGAVGRVSLAGHELLERPLSSESEFRRVLEVGGGGYDHRPHVRHRFTEYVRSDIDARTLGGRGCQCDGRALPFQTGAFDRLISIYNLEHLLEPHLVLKEWARVVRPGGVLSIAIPTEGGVAWGLGRRLTTRRHFRRLGFDYDYILAREHVNSCSRLVALIRHYFPARQESWYPLRVPSAHLNLVFAVTVTR